MYLEITNQHKFLIVGFVNHKFLYL